ncbi:ribosome maturation factor RimP [Corynebacterium bovis]|uniref:ribosome maturation factor RimP n=1 Tax=Corynebacterium bovis TaxID=36808 RepID=UPI0031391A40
MAFPTEQDLRSYLEPLAAEAGADVEYVTVTRAGAKSAVRVAVDGDPRPDLDRLEELSHRVSEAFDAAEERGDLSFGPGYTLEVTTPGVDMPLTQLRHWRRNVGRLVALPEGGGTVRVAGVAEGEDGPVHLILPGGKGTPPRVVARGLADVAGAVVEVEFSGAPAAERELIGRGPDDVDAAQPEDNK